MGIDCGWAKAGLECHSRVLINLVGAQYLYTSIIIILMSEEIRVVSLTAADPPVCTLN